MCCRTSLGAAEAQPARIESSAAYMIDTNRHRAPSRRSRPTVIASKRRHAEEVRRARTTGLARLEGAAGPRVLRDGVEPHDRPGDLCDGRPATVNTRFTTDLLFTDQAGTRATSAMDARPAGGGREAGHHGWRIIARHPHMSGDRSWQCHWDRFSSRRFSNVSKDSSNSSWLRSSLSRGRSRATLGLPVRSI